MSAEIVFYTNPMSRGRIVRWVLEELAVPYRTEIVEYGPPMKSAEYLAVNPMGKVPAIRHGPTIVTEAPAICAYLADAFPEAGLAPPSGERGAYYRWLFFAAGPLEAAVTNRNFGLAPPEDKEAMVGYGNFGLTMDTLEKAVAGGGYVAGEKLYGGRRLCRLAHRLGAAFRPDRETARLRGVLVAARRARSVSAGHGSRRCGGRRIVSPARCQSPFGNAR